MNCASLAVRSIWVVSPSYEYEDLGNPVGAFPTRDNAQAFVDHEIALAVKRHERRPDYEINEVYVSPPDLKTVYENT